MNKLIVLNGIQGSGKTTLGEFIAKKHNFKFIKIDTFYEKVPRVDNQVEWFEDIEYRENVYDAFEKAVVDSLKESGVIIEATGVDKRFAGLVENLKKHNVRMIKFLLKIDEDLAFERVTDRNKTDHPIKVTEDDLKYVVSKIDELDTSGYTIIDANQAAEDIYRDVLNYF